MKHLVELIHKAIASHLYGKVNEFTVSFPEGEFCKRDHRGRIGHEVSEPLPQISWLKSVVLREFGRKAKKRAMKKGGRFPHLTVLLGLAWLSPETPILLAPRSHSAASVYSLKKSEIQSGNQESRQQSQAGRAERKLLRVWGEEVDWFKSAQDRIG